jgi:hypothetical protein
VRFPSRRIDHVSLALDQDPIHTQITGLTIVAGGASQDFTIQPDAACVTNPLPFPFCPHVDRLSFPPVQADSVQLIVTAVRSNGGAPIGIAEVNVLDAPNPPIDLLAPPSGCVSGLVNVDGADVPVAIDAPLTEVLFPLRAHFHACRSVTLGDGNHRLDAGPQANVDDVSLRATDAAAPPTPRSAVSVSKATRTRVSVQSSDAMTVTNGQSYDGGWEASVDGHRIGAPRSLNTLNAWTVPAGAHVVTFRYRPDRTYRIALAITIATSLACALVAVRWRRRT